MKILIVEDEQHLAFGLKFNFEQEGYEVLIAGDGPTALKILKEHPIDLVILDLMLPGMSGYEICKEIRLTDRTLPILTLSAKNLAEDRTHAFDCGTDQYLSKPFNLQELLSRVRNLLNRQKHQRMMDTMTSDDRASKVVRLGMVDVDFNRFCVRRQDEEPVTEQPMTTMEASLLKFLIDNPAGFSRATRFSTRCGASRLMSRREPSTILWFDCGN